MHFDFIKSDSGYFEIRSEADAAPSAALRLPWQLLLDGKRVWNDLHGDDCHLLTGTWKPLRDHGWEGHTVIEDGIELAAWIVRMSPEDDVHPRAQITLVLFNSTSVPRATPALTVGIEREPDDRRFELRNNTVQIEDDSGTSWVWSWMHQPSVCGLANVEAMRAAVPRSTSQMWGVTRPELEQVRPDLVRVTLPLGDLLPAQSVITVCGELRAECGRARRMAA